jgi:hypothetical protein
MASAYNPSYLKGRDWEDHCLRPLWAKSLQIPSQQKSWVQWYHPNYMGSISKRITIQAGLGKKKYVNLPKNN